VAVSLAETLIVVGLVGLLLLPVLITSTTYFSGQILKTRQRLSLAHNVNLVLNQLTNHLGATNQLISSSTAETFTPADEIHYSFYDPVKATQVYSGFRLTTVSGRRKLEALQYSAGAWSAISPYRTSVATAYTLPSGTVFDYCNDDGCSKTPDQATFVRLTGWTFRDESAPARTYALPTTNIYLSSRRATEGKLTGQRAKLLYSTTPTQAFGSTANLELLALSPGRKTLWVIPDVVSSSGGIAPGLITIASALDAPGNTSMMVDETRGNVFLFDKHGSLYQWNSLLTTASLRVSGAVADGNDSSFVSPYSGRVYYGCNAGNVCTLRYYDPATNTISTITGSQMNWGFDGLVADPSRKVIYATWVDTTTNNNSGIIMYNEDTGVVTTVSNSTSGGDNNAALTLSLNPLTGRLYFAYRKASGSLMAWTPSKVGVNYESGTLLSTIGSGLVTLGAGKSIQALLATNNQVFFADNNGVYTWKDGDTGVTTIRSSSASSPAQWSNTQASSQSQISTKSQHPNYTYDAIRNIAYWYMNGANSGVYAYNFNTSTLSTLSATVGNGSGNTSLWLDRNVGNLYWGNSTASDLGVYQWNPATSTRTKLFDSSVAGAGRYGTLFVSPDSSKIFIGSSNTAVSPNVYNFTTGLSTIAAPLLGAIENCAVQDPVSGKVIFCGGSFSSLYVWDPNNGLTTLLATAPTGLNRGASAVFDTVRQYAVIGNGSSSTPSMPVYVWSYGTANGSSTTAIRKATPQGQPAGLLSLDFTSGGTYLHKAAAVDTSRNIFLLNKLANTIDRYAYNVGLNKYQLDATLTSSNTVINSVAALVIDPATTGLSVLNGNTKKVYVFTNRMATTSAITPASNFNVTEADQPTGMALDRRNGDYYIVDSAVSSNTIKVRRYTNGGVYKGSTYDLSIDVSASALGTSAATGEANFKITLDELKNVLYLAAPTLNRLYVLAIPEPAA
jgi:hypothetical protein